MDSCCMPHMRSLGPASGPGASTNGAFFKCCCCHADFSHRQEFEEHMLTEGHRYRMQQLMQHHLERTGHQLARLRAEEHLRMIEGKHSEDYCRICDKRFPGLFIHHRRSQEHRRKERLTKRGCKLCETGQFSQYPDYVQHIDSEVHKKRKEELQYVQQALQENFQEEAEDGPSSLEDRRSIGSSSSEDHENTVPVHRNGLHYEMRQNTLGKRGGDWDVSDSMYPSDAGVKRLRVNNEDVRSLSSEEGCDSVSSDGSEFIAPTQALFCQLCDQFFLTETGAKDKHCRSRGHQERYKAKMMMSENNNFVSRRDAGCSTGDDRCPPNITSSIHEEAGALAAAGKYLAIKVDNCDMLQSNDRENNQAIAKQLNSAVKMEIKYKNGEFIVRPLSSRFNQVESTRSKDGTHQDSLPSNRYYGGHSSNNAVFNSPAIYS